VEADVASVEADVASVEADVASVEADVASAEAEAEAVPMVVGAGRLHHQLEALAADGICCRPLRFRSCAAVPHRGMGSDMAKLIVSYGSGGIRIPLGTGVAHTAKKTIPNTSRKIANTQSASVLNNLLSIGKGSLIKDPPCWFAVRS
jgi:hypothetical protein